MIALLIIGVWLIGFFVQLRRNILNRAQTVEVHIDMCRTTNTKTRFQTHEMMGDHSFKGSDGFITYSGIFFLAVGWPLLFFTYLATLLFRLGRFLMFPKGIVTEYAKEKQKKAIAEADEKLRAANALAQEQRLVALAAQINTVHYDLGLPPIDFGPLTTSALQSI